jgi:septum formation protein
MENNSFKLILASASPRRKELLGHLKLPFEIITKNLPEVSHETDPAAFCREIAITKGVAVFNDCRILDPRKNFLVVSADTIVSLGPKIYGKPQDVKEAELFLSELSGRSHSVFTAVAMHLNSGRETYTHSFVEESKVTFDKISPVLMKRYLETKDSLDKAGAYGIQGGSLSFISRVEGDYANVVGFPLSRFVRETEAFLKFLTGEQSWFDLF